MILQYNKQICKRILRFLREIYGNAQNIGWIILSENNYFIKITLSASTLKYNLYPISCVFQPRPWQVLHFVRLKKVILPLPWHASHSKIRHLRRPRPTHSRQVRSVKPGSWPFPPQCLHVSVKTSPILAGGLVGYFLLMLPAFKHSDYDYELT